MLGRSEEQVDIRRAVRPKKGFDAPPHLTPISFDGDTVMLVGPDNEPFGAMNPIVENIGVIQLMSRTMPR